MKKSILIYEKNAESLEFLRDFFRSNRSFAATFFTNLKEFKKHLRAEPPHAVISGVPECLDRINPPALDCPVIAVVSKDIAQGMRSVVRYDLTYYLLAPFVKSDLDYKLKTARQGVNYIESLCQDNMDLEMIVNLTYHLTSTLDPEEVLYIIVKKISELIPVTRCSILSIGQSDGKMARVVSSFESASIEHIELDLNLYPEIEKALRTHKTVVIDDAMKDPIMAKVRKVIKPIGIKSIVVIPVVFRDEVIGTLFLRTSTRTHNFTPREIKLCQNIANASANALNNAFLFEKLKIERAELQQLAITDFLTGLYNIRYFYHRLSNEFSRAGRYGTELCCMMFDIDFFKSINDEYGHRVGDMVLREFATLVKDHVRESDVLARYGGEEFILLMPHTSIKGGIKEARRLGGLIKDHKFKGISESNRITVSTGLSIYPSPAVKTQDDLINSADKALLVAKDSGRDRMEVA